MTQMESPLDENMPCQVTSWNEADEVEWIKTKKRLLHYGGNCSNKSTLCAHRETPVYHLNMDPEHTKIPANSNSCCKRVWQKIKLHITRTCYLRRRLIFNEITMTPPLRIRQTMLREWPTALALGLAMERPRGPRPTWSYRGEGNANLVISLPKEKIILRFHKMEYNVRIECSHIKEEENKVKRDVQFGNAIARKFIGLAYVQPPHYSKFPDEEATNIDAKIHKIRPSHRRHKGVRCGWVTISPDYAFLPPILSGEGDLYVNTSINERATFCVELKPKQGWVHPEDRHHPKCTFCLNQYLKFDRKCVTKISNYCPLALFSGDEERMIVAIRNLLETPQNNLKIFKNGQLVYSDDYGNYLEVLKSWLDPHSSPENVDNEWLVKKWCTLIQRSLMRQLTEEPLSFNTHVDDETSRDIQPCETFINFEESPLANLFSCCDWSSKTLPPHCILNRILSMQKLQNSGFQSVYKEFNKMKKEETDYSYCKGIAKCNSLNLIERYLLATTAKDCSIMLAFRRICDSQVDVDTMHYIEDCDCVGYIMNIGVSDLDAKPLSCILKHYKRDKDVITACLRAAGLDANDMDIQPTSRKLSATNDDVPHCSPAGIMSAVD